MPFLQIYNEMHLQTSALCNTPPAISESISRLHAETSNTSLTRFINMSNNTSVSSPHSDPENRLVDKSQENCYLRALS